ncbi:hypothetical protein BB560_000249 [Smittium megazygosporum]|uniref:Uncharacterized protein n=1 Tax=Smittium megazygosporum TaxID=133381 RepID=A0A2T9ZKZ6_9FUNG|nr:hypothetical protein BB560_000249 [Smittium megazygosporum]
MSQSIHALCTDEDSTLFNLSFQVPQNDSPATYFQNLPYSLKTAQSDINSSFTSLLASRNAIKTQPENFTSGIASPHSSPESPSSSPCNKKLKGLSETAHQNFIPPIDKSSLDENKTSSKNIPINPCVSSKAHNPCLINVFCAPRSNFDDSQSPNSNHHEEIDMDGSSAQSNTPFSNSSTLKKSKSLSLEVVDASKTSEGSQLFKISNLGKLKIYFGISAIFMSVLVLLLCIFFLVALPQVLHNSPNYVEFFINSYKIRPIEFKQIPKGILKSDSTIIKRSFHEKRSHFSYLKLLSYEEISQVFSNNFRYSNPPSNSKDTVKVRIEKRDMRHNSVNLTTASDTGHIKNITFEASFWGFYINKSPFSIDIEFLEPLKIHWNGNMIGYIQNPQPFFMDQNFGEWSFLNIKICNTFNPPSNGMEEKSTFPDDLKDTEDSNYNEEKDYPSNTHSLRSKSDSTGHVYQGDEKSTSNLKQTFALEKSYENNINPSNTTSNADENIKSIQKQSAGLSEQEKNILNLIEFYYQAKSKEIQMISWSTTIRIGILGYSLTQPLNKNVSVSCTENDTCLLV